MNRDIPGVTCFALRQSVQRRRPFGEELWSRERPPTDKRFLALFLSHPFSDQLSLS